jgi:ferredoxin
MKVIERTSLNALFDAIGARGYTLVGPVVRDHTIVYDELSSPDDLPAGWTDEQKGGTYRLRKRDDNALFGYVLGPHSWKKYLYPPRARLLRGTRTGRNFDVEETPYDGKKYAFVGVRPCELNAILIQDRVFLRGKYVDPLYRSRRRDTIVIAVNCTEPGGTCFCTSMDTGPRAVGGYDLALTEIIGKRKHVFTVETGTERGKNILASVPSRSASKADAAAVESAIARAAEQMGKSFDISNIKELFYENYDHPHWNDVEQRCLTCANCTMVCPTCFCSTVEDTTDLSGDIIERWRRWDSCFTTDFSYIVGGSIRQSTLSRYRQWITHKLATWIDQFGTSGCVGCGRCITWCPVAIDIREETRALRAPRASEPAGTPTGGKT